MFQETITEFMKSVDLQSLQYLAAVKVAIEVCESEDVQNMIGSFRKTDFNDSTVGFSDSQWRRLCDAVRQKLDQIGLPDLIIGVILKTLWPIGFQIYKWSYYHQENLSIDLSTIFCWTPQVTIDYEKTAEILVENDAIDIKKRFELACFYCLELEVRSLWEQMSLSERRSFFVRGNLKKSNLNPIVLYWSYYIQEVETDYWGSKALNHTRLFIYAVQNGYLSATKFFFHKLKPSLRKRMISNCFYIHLFYACNPKCIVKSQSAVACFLVCQLPSDYYELTLYHTRGLVFHYFLGWPMQKHFLTVVNRLRRFLTETTYVDLLEGIFAKIIGNYQDYDYKKLFMEFWHLCPAGSKTYAREHRLGYQMLMKFVKRHFGFVFGKNSSIIKANFRAFVFQQESSRNIKYFSRENVEFFEFLVRERVTIKSSIEKFTSLANIRFHVDDMEFFNLPMGELFYLMDRILGNV